MKEVLRSETFSQALRAVVVAINTVFVVTAACALSNLPKRGEAFGSIARGLGASAVFVVIVLVCLSCRRRESVTAMAPSFPYLACLWLWLWCWLWLLGLTVNQEHFLCIMLCAAATRVGPVSSRTRMWPWSRRLRGSRTVNVKENAVRLRASRFSTYKVLGMESGGGIAAGKRFFGCFGSGPIRLPG